jgi:hypothetical protein
MEGGLLVLPLVQPGVGGVGLEAPQALHRLLDERTVLGPVGQVAQLEGIFHEVVELETGSVQILLDGAASERLPGANG